MREDVAAERRHVTSGSLGIVVPAYNEGAILPGTIRELRRFVEGRGIEADVIVVDDGSWDDSARIVESFARELPWLRLLRFERNHGKGFAVREGVLTSRGEIVLFTDADLSTPLDQLDRLVERLDEGYDVAIGSRAMDGSLLAVRQGPLREGVGRTWNVLVRHLVLPGFHDTQCGFKCFRRPAAMALFGLQRSVGFEFDVELLCLARDLGFRVAEVPVVWRNASGSHVRLLEDSGRMLLGLLGLRARFGSPRAGARAERRDGP